MHEPVMMWAWGIISPQVVQHLMALFVEDLTAAKAGDMSMELVEALRGLGAHGTVPGHCHRDLVKQFGLDRTPMPKPHTFYVPLKHKILGIVDTAMDMLLPHELFSSLYHNYKDFFFSYVLPGFDVLESFWNAVQGGLSYESKSPRFCL
jgi:hypothetical protein